MKTSTRAGLALAFLAGALTVPQLAIAGGTKDTGMAGMKDAPVMAAAPSGRSYNCYGRIDAIGSFYQDPDAFYAGNLPGGGVVARGPATDVSLDNGFGVELGVGCSLSRLMGGGSIKDAPVETPSGLRFEFAYSYRAGADFEGTPPLAPPADPILTEISSHAFMANFYWDFHGMGRFQPYLGAGVGLSLLEVDDVTIINGVDITFDGDRETNFAWQLMAGVGIDLGGGAMLDVGYRFVSLGSVEVNKTAFQGGAALAEPSILEIEDVYAHEIKIGLRFPLH